MHVHVARPREDGSSRATLRGLVVIGAVLALVGCGQTPGGPDANRAPSAAFSASPLTGPAPLTVAFDGSSSADPDGTIAAYGWLMGDGTPARSGVTTTHTYAVPGVYTPRLTVTDNLGATASAERTISVTTTDGNVPPIASFTAAPAEGPAPHTVTFDASASRDTDGAIVGYAWDFGDTGTATGVAAQHTFTLPGTYVVRLTVTDDRGATAAAEASVVVATGEGSGSARAQALGSAYDAIEATAKEPRPLIAAVIDAALEATRLNGGTPTLTGTLTQTGPEAFTYAASPPDRLRLVLLDGRAFDVTFHALPDGDFSGDGDRFFRRPHTIDATVTSNAVAGSLDLRISSAPGSEPLTQAGSLVGAFDGPGGHRWSVDVTYQTFERAEVDIGINERESISLTTGTVLSASLGIEANLSRYDAYKLVNTVENVDREIDHAITWNGATYRLRGRVFVAFRDAQPVDRDQWVIVGELRENGTVIGQYEATEDVLGLTIWLVIGQERHQLYFFSYL
jgi:PKD repeat protein